MQLVISIKNHEDIVVINEYDYNSMKCNHVNEKE